jgi:hypothetical protein
MSHIPVAVLGTSHMEFLKERIIKSRRAACSGGFFAPVSPPTSTAPSGGKIPLRGGSPDPFSLGLILLPKTTSKAFPVPEKRE